MKVFTITICVAAAVLFIALFAVIFLTLLEARCDNCPHKKECSENENFECPFKDQYTIDHFNPSF